MNTSWSWPDRRRKDRNRVSASTIAHVDRGLVGPEHSLRLPDQGSLNNLDVRLERYCSLLGRRSTLWHGDVKQAARRRILREPPDCLLTTPESLEVMLVSATVDSRSLFSNLRLVIVDEIHAFAGDDRGWHLLAVLERISRIAAARFNGSGCPPPWATRRCYSIGSPVRAGDRAGCFGLKQSAASQAEVMLDYVGSLENAAVMISRLHRGEKRLVFVDSRRRRNSSAQTCANWMSRLSSLTVRSARSKDSRRSTHLLHATTVSSLRPVSLSWESMWGIWIASSRLTRHPRSRASYSEWAAPAGEVRLGTASSLRRATTALCVPRV